MCHDLYSGCNAGQTMFVYGGGKISFARAPFDLDKHHQARFTRDEVDLAKLLALR